MKKILFGVLMVGLVVGPLAPKPVLALSCLPDDMFATSVVSDDIHTVFIGTSQSVTEGNEKTFENVTVSKALKGTIETNTTIVYPNDATWGPMCSGGAAKQGTENLYIVSKDEEGAYNVSRRILSTDPLVNTIETDLAKASVSGTLLQGTSSVATTTPTTTSTLTDLLMRLKDVLEKYLSLLK